MQRKFKFGSALKKGSFLCVILAVFVLHVIPFLSNINHLKASTANWSFPWKAGVDFKWWDRGSEPTWHYNAAACDTSNTICAIDFGINTSDGSKKGIYAMADGTIVDVEKCSEINSNYVTANVTINHGGVIIKYRHLIAAQLTGDVVENSTIAKGTKIGILKSGDFNEGGCGNASQDDNSAHIHIEIRSNIPSITMDGWTFTKGSTTAVKGTSSANHTSYFTSYNELSYKDTETTFSADVNNDGLDDIVKVDKTSEKFTVWTSNGVDYNGGKTWYDGDEPYPNLVFKVGNFDGINGDDILAIDPTKGRFIIWKSNGFDKFSAGVEWRNDLTDYSSYKFMVGNINSNKNDPNTTHFDDIIAVDPLTEDTVVWTSSGTNFNSSSDWTSQTHEYAAYTFGMGDINSDGFDDMLAVNPDGGRMLVWRSNTINGFHNGQVGRDPDGLDYLTFKFKFGDVNGDGHADIVAAKMADEDAYVWKGTGTSAFSAKQEWFNLAREYPNSEFLLGKANSDDRVDMIGADMGDLRFLVWRSHPTNDAFEIAQEWLKKPDLTTYSFDVSDINSDGRADVIGMGGAEEKFIAWNSDTSNTFLEWKKQYDGVYEYDDYQFFTGDVNKDTDPNTVDYKDIIAVDPFSERFLVWINNAGTFSNGQQWRDGSFNYTPWQFHVADASGDGKVDIIAVDTVNEKIVVWQSNGSDYSQAGIWFQPATGVTPNNYSAYKYSTGDVNNDGKADITAINPSNGRILVWRSTGSGYLKAQQQLAGSTSTNLYTDYKFMAGDVNNDNLVDIVGVDAVSEKFLVWKSTGTTFSANQTWFDASFNYSSYKFRMGDVDNDGDSDVVAIGAGTEHFVVWKSNGSNSFSPTVWHKGP